VAEKSYTEVIEVRRSRDAGGPATDFHELLARAKAGDAEAAGDLLWAYKSRVWRIAYSIVQHQQDTEDVVQDTFLRAFRGVKGLQACDQRVLEVWLVTIAINCAKDTVVRRPLAPPSTWAPDSPDEHTLPLAEQTALNLGLQGLLRELPFTQRSASVLVDMYGFTRDEAAEMLGIPRGTIDSSLFAARKKLRKGWEPEHV
jgi:RNA polymerase sigma-70 factor (ECF subfamily)